MRQDQAQTHAERMRALIDRIEALPSAPASAQRILDIVTKEPPDMAELTDALAADPAVCARILRHANTASFNRFEKVDDIRQAIMFLGTDVVCTLALCVCVREGLLASFESGDPALREVWRHSLACACAAKLVAERCRPGLAGVCFAAGLLHDCGKLALLAVGGEAYGKLLADEFLVGPALVEAEQRALGVDHCLAGKWLLERWELPRTLCDAAWMHHQPIPALIGFGQDMFIPAVAALADRLAHEALGTLPVLASGGEAQELARFLGLTPQEDLPAVRQGVGQAFAERAALFDLAEDAAAFYCNALSRANRRLGGSNIDLACRGRELERDARALRSVAQGAVELAAADTPQNVLRALAVCLRERFAAPDGYACLYDVESGLCRGFAWGPGGAVRPLELPLPVAHARQDQASGRVHAAVAMALSGWKTRAGALHGPEGPPLYFQEGVASVALSESGGCYGELLYRPGGGGGGLQPEERSAVGLLAQMTAQAFRRLDLVRRCEARSERLSEVMRSMQDLNEKLLKTQRLAAVGQLAAGAAHEINNPLAIISARAQLLAMRSPDEATKKGLNQMVEQIERISAILGSLMDFARPASPRMERVKPAEVMERVLGLTEGGLGSLGVTVVRDFRPGVPEIKADPRQLEQVLLNLVLNAQHAMEGRNGRLTVSVAAQPDADSVTVSVADTGMGIPRENLAKIFDPFFTTKSEGKGTGLGLSTAYGIVQAHRGRIDVASRPGEGSIFTVVLPREQFGQVQGAAPAPERETRQAVLVVDDERHIRDILREALQSKGYEVVLAEDGEKALSLLRANRYRLMILDIRMPSRDGLALMREAGSFLDASMPVLVLTGLASEQEEREALDLGVSACLRKPFQLEELLAEVGRLLDGGATP